MEFYKKNIIPLLRPLAAVFIVISAFFALSTCQRVEENDFVLDMAAAEIPQPESIPAPERYVNLNLKERPEAEPEYVYSGPTNPLTGLPVDEEIHMNRPIAVIISNIREATPHVGISRADIIYETLVEGGITRMLLLFQDSSRVTTLGSVRSARTYFVDIAQSYDAILIFAGGSPQAYAEIRNRGITHLDGVGGRAEIFYRDRGRERTMGFVHSLVTTGTLLTQWLPQYGFRLEHEDGYVRNLRFSDYAAPENGGEALTFSVNFSSSKSTTFRFNQERGLYYVSQHGGPLVDGLNSTQIAATNILILRAPVSGVPGDREGRLIINTVGTGSGYFVNGGKYIEIEWSRADNNAQFEYTLLDGSPLILGRGLTYICIIPTTVDVDFG